MKLEYIIYQHHTVHRNSVNVYCKYRYSACLFYDIDIFCLIMVNMQYITIMLYILHIP